VFERDRSFVYQPCGNGAAQYIPMPNIATTASGQNFHYVTSAESNSDTVTLRLIHNFGASSGPGFGPFVVGGGGGGGGGGRRRAQKQHQFWAELVAQFEQPGESIPFARRKHGNARAERQRGLGVQQRAREQHVRLNYNHITFLQRTVYEREDVAGTGGAGIIGISNDPFDWGLPGISLLRLEGQRSDSAARTGPDLLHLGDGFVNRGKHNWRFGGDYRRILQSFRSARNAEAVLCLPGSRRHNTQPGVRNQ